MVGRRDEDRIDVLAIEDAAVVDDGLELEGLARGGHPLLELGLVDFRGRDELAISAASSTERIEHASRPVAAADDRHADPVVGPLPSEQRLGGRDGQRGRRRFQEVTPALHEPVLLERLRSEPTPGFSRRARVAGIQFGHEVTSFGPNRPVEDAFGIQSRARSLTLEHTGCP